MGRSSSCLSSGCESWCRPRRMCVTRYDRDARCVLATATEFTRLADPELVDEQAPVGVELVIADACGKDGQVARVVQRHPGGFRHEFPVDGSPPACRRAG